MKRLRLWAVLLCAGLPASAATLTRVVVPSIGLSIGAFSGAPLLSSPASLSASPALSAPALLAPSLTAASAPLPALEAAPAAAPAFAATENGLIRTPDASVGLAELRRASYDMHPQVAEIVARINAAHPELPISAENLFLVRDLDVLRRLEIPEEAAGAARILFDGKREIPVVILVAAHPVGIDNFVEFGVHEAVHLMDDGILRVPHDAELKHFFAEGWTQKRAVDMANEVLAGLGRPATPGKAYHKEIELVNAFIALHGSAALDELVRTGSDTGMRAALGARWDLAERVVSGDGGAKAPRERRLNALIALVNAKSVGPDEERALLDYVRR
ncbi:MAG TPA: hypothetical protein VH309_03055 [Elusimicrobiota bacterium]|jgi:hypothetical protein|nr:hypothetical protein [Elusimicrobiota bacterium]